MHRWKSPAGPAYALVLCFWQCQLEWLGKTETSYRESLSSTVYQCSSRLSVVADKLVLYEKLVTVVDQIVISVCDICLLHFLEPLFRLKLNILWRWVSANWNLMSPNGHMKSTGARCPDRNHPNCWSFSSLHHPYPNRSLAFNV